MTRMEILAELAVAEAELRTVTEDSDRLSQQQGFLDRFQALDLGARATAARQRIFHLKGEMAKQVGKR